MDRDTLTEHRPGGGPDDDHQDRGRRRVGRAGGLLDRAGEPAEAVQASLNLMRSATPPSALVGAHELAADRLRHADLAGEFSAVRDRTHELCLAL